MGGKVRIVRNQFVACEVTAKIDIQTAAEDRLQGSMPPAHSGTLPNGQPIGANPADGLIDFRLVIQIDDATDTVSIIGYYGADPADVDGLWLFGTRPGQTPAPNPGFGLNFFGTTIVFMPLIDAAVGAVANDGALAELGMTAGMLAIPAAIAALAEAGNSPIKVLCERVIWYGGEVQFRSRPSGVECVILFDMEAALSVDVSIGNKTLLKIERDSPLSVRYKAVGVRIGDNPALGRFQFKPVFDASKGYTIDVSKPGSIKVASPLDQILTVLGARIARNNPLMFEIDLGFAVDLGVVSIERARVRLQFDPLGPPQLTAFAAGIDIPGALRGRGYMEMNENEIKGQIDVTIVPVQVRIAAGLGVANINENGRRRPRYRQSRGGIPRCDPARSVRPRHLWFPRPVCDALPPQRAATVQPCSGLGLVEEHRSRQPRQHRGLGTKNRQLGLRCWRGVGHHGLKRHLQHEGRDPAGIARTSPAVDDEGQPARRPAPIEGHGGRHVPRRDRPRHGSRHTHHRHLR